MTLAGQIVASGGRLVLSGRNAKCTHQFHHCCVVALMSKKVHASSSSIVNFSQNRLADRTRHSVELPRVFGIHSALRMKDSNCIITN